MLSHMASPVPFALPRLLPLGMGSIARFRRPLLDDDARRLAPGVAERLGHLLPDARGDRLVGPGVGAGGIADHDGAAAVGGLADRHVERDLAEELGAELLRLVPRPAVA